jgi:hypothetical protein
MILFKLTYLYRVECGEENVIRCKQESFVIEICLIHFKVHEVQGVPEVITEVEVLWVVMSRRCTYNFRRNILSTSSV